MNDLLFSEKKLIQLFGNIGKFSGMAIQIMSHTDIQMENSGFASKKLIINRNKNNKTSDCLLKKDST